MNYVLAHNCQHTEHDPLDECGEVAYLYEHPDNSEDKIVKLFDSRSKAATFMVDNGWGPLEVMIIPQQEMV